MLSKNPNTVFHRQAQLTEALQPQSNNSESFARFTTLFSDRNLCGLILSFLSDKDFLTFGHVCTAFHDVVALNPRYYVLSQNYRLKTHYNDSYFQAFYTRLVSKYQDPKGLFITTDLIRGNQYRDISDWSQHALHCFKAFHTSVLASRLSHLQRQEATSDMQKLMRCVSLVLPGTTLPITDFAQRLKRIPPSDFNKPIITALIGLTECVASMSAAQRENFISLCRNTTTSFFAEFYALLDIGKLNFQYLNKDVNQAVTTNRFTLHRNAINRTSNYMQTISQVISKTRLALIISGIALLSLLLYQISTGNRSRALRYSTIFMLLIFISYKLLQITSLVGTDRMNRLGTNPPQFEEPPEDQMERGVLNPNL